MCTDYSRSVYIQQPRRDSKTRANGRIQFSTEAVVLPYYIKIILEWKEVTAIVTNLTLRQIHPLRRR